VDYHRPCHGHHNAAQNAPLNELKLENMIGTDVAAGYVDYPTLAEMETAAV